MEFIQKHISIHIMIVMLAKKIHMKRLLRESEEQHVYSVAE